MIDQKKLNELAASSLKDMEVTAARMRELIVAMPPRDLLGYIYSQHILKAMAGQSATKNKPEANQPNDLLGECQFLLEYVHAVFASDPEPEVVAFDEARCAELFALNGKLRMLAMHFAMATSAETKDGLFGPDTADIEVRAKSTWVMLRGNRYQVLEGEFYRYVLRPHDDVLKEVYGVGSDEIAEGFQAMANATHFGQAAAIAVMSKQFEAVQNLAKASDQPFEEATEAWLATNSEEAKAVGTAMDDLLRGGIANMSRHTKLPTILLGDLAYRRGEEAEFFAAGDFVGTPYRTLPARKKPLIQLGSDYYAVDPCFIRDAGYRALLHNLLLRKPEYKKSFENRQKEMSESAFADILTSQLPGAIIFREVYYKDPVTKQWSENDTLILIDDVLFLVEAKAGAAATIASPALDFGRHAQSVQDLVLKAYKQCERFFNYLTSAEEVSLYRLVDGKYEECGRVRSSDYRVMVPIGLTVESFSPFSAYCKELPQVEPILGKHAFVSLSIDDLFVLRRFLPTTGSFAHYMEVRQAVAGIRRAHIFDEFDHLGAYIKKNRFDLEIADQIKKGKLSMLIWDGMSDVVDKSFEGEDWEVRSLPAQFFPEEVLNLLKALDATRESKWLRAESYIRDLGEEARSNLGRSLSDLRRSLSEHPARYFTLVGDGEALFAWIQRLNENIDWDKVNEKASAAALAADVSNVICVVAEIDANGSYHRAYSFTVDVPTGRSETNAHIYEDAARMKLPIRRLQLNQREKVGSKIGTKKPGRNEPCPCGSGTKFKWCHGR